MTGERGGGSGERRRRGEKVEMACKGLARGERIITRFQMKDIKEGELGVADTELAGTNFS